MSGAAQRSAEQLLQALGQPLELFLETLLALFDCLDPLRDGIAQIARNSAARGPARRPADRTARSLLATATATLAAKLAEDVHRLLIKTPRTPLPLVRQAIGVETDVTHERRIGNPGRLANLRQRQQAAGLLCTGAARRSRRGRVLARAAAARGHGRRRRLA